MLASILRQLAALFCVVVPLVPLAGLFAGQHNCACGMEDACFCDMGAAPGAHCRLRGSGECSLRPLQIPSGAALIASFDLRGWLQTRSWPEAGPGEAPVVAVSPLVKPAPQPFLRAPEPPPPRFFAFA